MIVVIIIGAILAYKVGCVMALNKFRTGSCFKWNEDTKY